MGAEQSQLQKVEDSVFIKDRIIFFINGKEYIVKTDRCDPEIGPQYLLVDYLRDKIGLTGTKYMCREGGCGSCMVNSNKYMTGQQNVGSANSCLLPLFACDGLEITTVEALGNRKEGYNPIQKRLVKFGGTQDTILCPIKAVNIGSKDNSMEMLNIPRNLHLKGSKGEQWFKVTTLAALFEILERFTSSRLAYRLVAGVYKNDGPYQGFIEINEVPELQLTTLEENSLILGGGVTITNAITFFNRASKMEGFVYAKEFYDHLRRVAALSVRNRATIAGSLMLKHQHREFKSDLFVLFESVRAKLRIAASTYIKYYTLLEFLELDMNGKVILSVHFPTYKGTYFFRSFKVGKRYQNAISYVNAAFLFNIDPKTFTVLERPSICYGGINPDFVHANDTEEFLKGQQLNATTLKDALLRLQQEAVPNLMAGDASPEYRLGLAQSYLYKFVLGVLGNEVEPRIKSGADEIPRGNNKGTQVFDSDRKQWPLNQPVTKIESFPQTSGMTPGVVAFITAKDIPGNNNHAAFLTQPDEIFIESRVRYAGQPVGLLVATDKYTAFEARSKVIVTYDNVQKPILDIRESIHTNAEFNAKMKEETSLAFPCRGINAQRAKNLLMNISSPQQIDHEVNGDVITIKGEFFTPPQYHFHMETQICICVPNEDGMDVYSGTQHMDAVQAAVAGCLNVPNNSITVHVRRLGGAFGAKITKANHVAAACAVAAHVTQKPVRVVLDLETNMQAFGKRLPYLFKYKVKVNPIGKIRQLEASVYCDPGSVSNEPTSLFGTICFQSTYRANNWNIKPEVAVTNTAPNTYCRAPGSSQGVAGIETVMEHIAFILKKDPLEVRQVNFMEKGDAFIGVPGATLPLDNLLPGMTADLKVSGDYETRKKFVEVFNQTNRWKKRGLSIVPQRYPNFYPDLRFPTFIAVYHVERSSLFCLSCPSRVGAGGGVKIFRERGKVGGGGEGVGCGGGREGGGAGGQRVAAGGEGFCPLIDIGQIEGAVVMGFGWWLTEELIYDKNTGELLTDNTWQYKPMMPADIPEDFRVTLLRNAPNPFGVLSSKTCAEAPLDMTCSVIFSLRNAIDSARREVGNYDWYQM
ncbi:putative aldehyde oxidase-like protein, partial [Orchesella cincta]